MVECLEEWHNSMPAIHSENRGEEKLERLPDERTEGQKGGREQQFPEGSVETHRALSLPTLLCSLVLLLLLLDLLCPLFRDSFVSSLPGGAFGVSYLGFHPLPSF
jgi:hypothetical protein